jgi:hypothetical protein
VYGQQKGRFNGPWGCGAVTEGYLGTSEAIGDLDQQVYMPWYEAQSHQDGVGEDVVEHCLSQQ